MSPPSLSLSPASLAAVSNAVYGAVILAAPARSYSTFFNTPADSVPSGAIGVAKFDGLAILQNATLCLAASRCTSNESRKAVNAALAVNSIADAFMTQHQRRKHGLDATHANVSTAICAAVGAYAAYHVWRDCKGDKESKSVPHTSESEVSATLKKAL
jgi:hypothetical protein